MNTDKELLASEKQAVTATAVSTDSILVAGLTGISRSRNMRAFAQVETGFTGGTGTGMTVELIQADNVGLTANIEALSTSGAKTTVAAGNRLLDVPLPEFTKPYAGFRYTPTTGAYAAGVITAGFVIGTETPMDGRPPYETNGF